MKVFGITAGRKMGNSEIMLKEAFMAAEDKGAEVEMVNLHDCKILPCTGCEACTMQVMKGKMPKDGTTVKTAMGPARVVGSNPLKGTVVVELESQVTVELPINDVKFNANTPQHKTRDQTKNNSDAKRNN